MEKLRPFYVRRWLRDFKYQHRYLHDMLKTFITMVSVAFGLFIAFIGLQNAHIIGDNQFTLVELVPFNNSSISKSLYPSRFFKSVILFTDLSSATK